MKKIIVTITLMPVWIIPYTLTWLCDLICFVHSGKIGDGHIRLFGLFYKEV